MVTFRLLVLVETVLTADAATTLNLWVPVRIDDQRSDQTPLLPVVSEAMVTHCEFCKTCNFTATPLITGDTFPVTTGRARLTLLDCQETEVIDLTFFVAVAVGVETLGVVTAGAAGAGAGAAGAEAAVVGVGVGVGVEEELTGVQVMADK